MLPDLLGERLQHHVVGRDVAPGRAGLQRSQVSPRATLLADAHRSTQEVDVLRPQSARLTDAQPQPGERDDERPVGRRRRSEHRGDVLIGQVDLPPARGRRRSDRRGRIGREQPVGHGGVEDLSDLAQHLTDRARCQGLRPPSDGRGHVARPDGTHRMPPQRRKDVPVQPGPLADSRRVRSQQRGMRRAVLLGKLHEGYRGPLGVDVAAGELRRLHRGEMALGVDLAVEDLDHLRTRGIPEARVPPRPTVSTAPLEARHCPSRKGGVRLPSHRARTSPSTAVEVLRIVSSQPIARLRDTGGPGEHLTSHRLSPSHMRDVRPRPPWLASCSSAPCDVRWVRPSSPPYGARCRMDGCTTSPRSDALRAVAAGRGIESEHTCERASGPGASAC